MSTANFADFYNKALQTGNLNKKINYLSKAITHWQPADGSSEHAKAYLERAKCYFQNGDNDAAIADALLAIKKGLDNNTNIAEAYYCCGEAAKNLEDYKAALRYMAKSIKADPNTAKYYRERGRLYYDQSDDQKALKDITKALVLNPNDDVAYCYRAFIRAAEEDYEAAVTDLSNAILLSPYQTYYYYRAIYYNKMSEDHLSIQDFLTAEAMGLEKAREQRLQLYGPQTGADYFDIGINQMQAPAFNKKTLSTFQKAIDLLLKTSKEQGDYDWRHAAYAYNNMGIYICMHQKGKLYDKAAIYFDKAIEMKPDYVEAYVHRSNLQWRQGDYDAALAGFDTAIKLNNNYADAYYNRGILWDDLGENQKAIKDYTQAIKIGYGDKTWKLADAYYNRAKAYVRKGNKKAAMADLDAAQSLGIDFASIVKVMIDMKILGL